jgi:hypothetical protein
MAAIALFADRLAAAVRDPGWETVALVAAVGALVAGAFYGLRRWLRRAGSGGEAGPAD